MLGERSRDNGEGATFERADGRLLATIGLPPHADERRRRVVLAPADSLLPSQGRRGRPLNRIGPFLLQLEIVERSQEFGHLLVSQVRNGRSLSILDTWGETHIFEPGASAAEVIGALSQGREGIWPVNEFAANEFDDRVGVWPAWTSLLYDLGANESELLFPNPDLRYRAVVRRGNSAEITVSNGTLDGLFVKELDRGRLEDIPADLGWMFRREDPKMKFSIAD